MTNYVTVSEYAKITGKDPGNIRRMLIKGRIKGKKFGNQWMIPEDAKYPEDRRIRSGEYVNWRKKVNINHNVPGLLQSLEKLSSDVSDIYGEFLYKIVLYGSYARGDQTTDSDVDIAVILKSGNVEEMHENMLDIVVDYELNLGLTLSVIPIEYDNYEKWSNILPFYRNIDREGMILWSRV